MALRQRETFISSFAIWAFAHRCVPGVTEELSLPAAPLNAIFKSLLEVLLKTSGSYQRVRTNLYGALLYYLQIGQQKGERFHETGKKQHCKSREHMSREWEYRAQRDCVFERREEKEGRGGKVGEKRKGGRRGNGEKRGEEGNGGRGGET